jgi:hypothetical protein
MSSSAIKHTTLASASEILNFYWHCDVAARLLTELPQNAVTSAHTRDAVTKATLCWAGAKGIIQASERALARRAELGKPWAKCKLVREHVIPASYVHARVVEALASDPGDDLRAGWAAINADMEAYGVPDATIRRHQMHHQTHLVAQAVREWTELAWVTDEDHLDLKRAGLTKVMPDPWDPSDRHARYTACNLRLLTIPPHQRG